MNAAIRGIYSRAVEKGYRVIGIRDGYTGLLNEDMYELSFDDVAEIIPLGEPCLVAPGVSNSIRKKHRQRQQTFAGNMESEP